nr:hypothetical protein [Tanacetum cinerariifolium]
MARLQFCDYHNMVAILEKSEHNTDFHPMMDFIEASPLRIEKMDKESQILVTVDGIHRTVSESSLRRNLKLQDEEGISSLPDMELFENLTMMGYNISLNQKFTFQKGQFYHQWKYFIHTIMQCLSPKSTWFNKFSSNIATALICLATNRTYNFLKMIFDGLVKNVNNKVSKLLMYLRFLTMCLRMTQFGQITHTKKYVVPFHTKNLFITLRVNSPSFSSRIVPLFDSMLVQQGEGLGTPTEPHHTPSLEAQSPSHTTHTSPTLPPVTTTFLPTVTQSDTPIVRQYTSRTRIAQSSVLLTVADEPEVEINRLKERVKMLEDRKGVAATRSGDDALINGKSIDEGEATTKRISDDSKEMETLLTSMDAAIVLASGVVDVPTGSGSIPTASTPAEEQVPTGSDAVPTASPVFATATVVTPYRRRKDNYAKIYKYQSQQRKPVTKKQKRDYYMAVIRNNLGWKVKEFRGMTFEEVEAKFNLVWKKMEDFIPISLKEEAERIKRKGLNLEQESAKKQKTSDEVPEEAMYPEEVPEEKVKEMMQLVPIEEVYVEALQVKHPIIDWKVYIEGQRSYWKITRLAGSSASYQFFIDLLKHLDREDLNQLWILVKETLSNRPPTSDKEIEL